MTNKFYKRSIFVALSFETDRTSLLPLPHPLQLCYLNSFVVCADKYDWRQIRRSALRFGSGTDWQKNKPRDNGEYFLMFRLISGLTIKIKWLDKQCTSGSARRQRLVLVTKTIMQSIFIEDLSWIWRIVNQRTIKIIIRVHVQRISKRICLSSRMDKKSCGKGWNRNCLYLSRRAATRSDSLTPVDSST